VAFKVLCVKPHEVSDEVGDVFWVDVGHTGTAHRDVSTSDKWQVQWSRGTKQPSLIGAVREYSTEELLGCSILDCDSSPSMLRLLESLSRVTDKEFWQRVDELDLGERVKIYVPATDFQELARILFSKEPPCSSTP